MSGLGPVGQIHVTLGPLVSAWRASDQSWHSTLTVHADRVDGGVCSAWNFSLTAVTGANNGAMTVNTTGAAAEWVAPIVLHAGDYDLVQADVQCDDSATGVTEGGRSGNELIRTPDGIMSPPSNWLANGTAVVGEVASVVDYVSRLATTACLGAVAEKAFALGQDGSPTFPLLAKVFRETCVEALAAAAAGDLQLGHAGGDEADRADIFSVCAQVPAAQTNSGPCTQPPPFLSIAAAPSTCGGRTCLGVTRALADYRGALHHLGLSMWALRVSEQRWWGAQNSNDTPSEQLQSGVAKLYVARILSGLSAVQAAGVRLAHSLEATSSNTPTVRATSLTSARAELLTLLNEPALANARLGLLHGIRAGHVATLRAAIAWLVDKPVAAFTIRTLLEQRPAQTISTANSPPPDGVEVYELLQTASTTLSLTNAETQEFSSLTGSMPAVLCSAPGRSRNAVNVLQLVLRAVHSFPGPPVADPSGELVLDAARAYAASAAATDPPGCAAPPPPKPPFYAFGGYGQLAGELWYPQGIAVGANNVYVADGNNSRVEVYTLAGNYVQTIGRPAADRNNLTPGDFITTSYVAVDPATGDVFVTDWNAARVQVFAPDGTFLRTWGTPGGGPGQFSTPGGIAVSPDGKVYVVDVASRVEVFTEDGSFLAQWPANLNTPRGISVDRSGNVWISDFTAQQILEYTRSGKLLRTVQLPAPPRGGLFGPYGTALEPNGNLWVADRFGFRLEEITPKGVLLQTIDSYGPDSEPISPGAVACSTNGNLYVVNLASAGGDRVLVFGNRCH
jgi:streptogramin lyase